MGAFRTGRVVALLEERPDIVRFDLQLDSSDDGPVEVVGFPAQLGPVAAGDRVVVNTTGIELGLDTGGVAFALWNLDGSGVMEPGEGHIVKLRYTPWQTEVLATEAPESPHHEALKDVVSVDGMPVVACGLHSQLAAACAGIKAARPDARIGYLMTDSAALPLAWSRLVAQLRGAELLDVTCTAGHAFGGDLEAVNVFSGLAALRVVGKVDVTIAVSGPGVVGTDTTLGFSAIEQGQVLDAVTAMDGRAIGALRISFTDLRSRHVGVSHHTLTALTVAARERCLVAVPLLPDDRMEMVMRSLTDAGVADRHELRVVDGGPGLRLLADRGLRPSSMGRTLDETPELFVAAAAAGILAATL